MLEAADILDVFHFYRVVDNAWVREDKVQENARRAVLSSVKEIDQHYTYTLDEGADDEDVAPDEIDDDAIDCEDKSMFQMCVWPVR